MSKIEISHPLQIAPDFNLNQEPQLGSENETPTESVSIADDNWIRHQFKAAQGDHDGGNKHSLAGKKPGDQVTIVDGVLSLTGTVLNDTGDTLEVLVDNQVYVVDKKTGTCLSRRKATEQDMERAAQMQQYQQQEQARTQEREREEAKIQERKATNKQNISKAHQKKNQEKQVNEKKSESRRDEIARFAEEKENNKFFFTQFDESKSESEILTVSAIILGKRRNV